MASTAGQYVGVKRTFVIGTPTAAPIRAIYSALFRSPTTVPSLMKTQLLQCGSCGVGLAVKLSTLRKYDPGRQIRCQLCAAWENGERLLVTSPLTATLDAAIKEATAKGGSLTVTSAFLVHLLALASDFQW